jgi:AraC-like DNA-binding protein
MWERSGVEQCSADTLWMIAYPSGARLHFSYSRGEQISASPAVFVPDHQLIVLAELLVDETRGEERDDRQFVVKYLDLIYSRLAHGVCLESAMIELPNSYRPAEEIALINASPLERAIKYIERNFDSRITLDDIARASYMSRAQLTRLFRRDRGQTVLEYVTHCRLEMAKSLLRYDSFSLHHIARLSGFGNVAYLSRQFSRHVGMPPSDYRQISDKTSI